MVILYILLALVALILLAAAIMPKTLNISSEIVIEKPSTEVFNYVKNIKNQEKYSVWVMADPNIKIDYKGTDGTVGFISSWTSDNKNVGVGAQEITAIKEGERYDVELRFEKPFKATNQAYTTTIPIDANRTKVTTVFTGRNPFPMNLMIPMIRKILIKDMNQNFTNLKKILEG
ncbi:MAG: SRPBCC family protein [Cyclobacteriaceae bacterium]